MEISSAYQHLLAHQSRQRDLIQNREQWQLVREVAQPPRWLTLLKRLFKRAKTPVEASQSQPAPMDCSTPPLALK